MKNLIVCVAFFAIAIGLSNVSMAECGLRDRVACVGCKAKVAVKRMSRSTMCRVQSVKSKTVSAVKSVPCRVRRGAKKVMQSRPRVVRCCVTASTEISTLTLPATIVLPVAVMPEADIDLVLEDN
jgi:hypothetical protein